MTTPPEIARKVRQLAAGQAEHGTKLDAILELLRGGPTTDNR